MDIAIVFEWFAQESAFAAGLTQQPSEKSGPDWHCCGRSPQLSVLMKQERSARMLRSTSAAIGIWRNHGAGACKKKPRRSGAE